MKKKPKITERANADVESPKEGGMDFVEIPMPNEELDKLVQKNATIIAQRADPALRRKVVRRQERLLRKIFKASTQVLTDDQFQIFTLRYVYQLPEKEIAQQIGCIQNYVSRVLKASIKKIQKRLRVPVNLKGFSRARKVKDEE